MVSGIRRIAGEVIRWSVSGYSGILKIKPINYADALKVRHEIKKQ